MQEYQLKFIASVKEGAIDGYLKYGLLPSVTIAQAILESGWGKSHIEHNLFGMKWVEGCGFGKKLVTTHEEYINGHKEKVEAYFRTYKDFSESIKDHNRLIGTANRYKPVLTAKTYTEQAHMIWKCGYATDSKYPALLVNVINSNKLYLIDAEAKQRKERGGK